MAENKKKVEEEKKAISKTDGQTVIRTAAGWAVAATEYLDVATTGASQIADTINQLDAALTQLANLDLDGSCKKKTFEFSPGSEGDGTLTGEDFVHQQRAVIRLETCQHLKNWKRAKRSKVQMLLLQLLELWKN